MNTGEIIKTLRKSKRLTQEQLGEIVGVKKSAIAKYEKGRVENLKRATIEKLANYFNVSPSYILGMQDESMDIMVKYKLLSPEHKKQVSQQIDYYLSIDTDE